MIRINDEVHGGGGLNISITQRAKTVLLAAYQWAGHQCAAYEGKVAEVRIVRPTVEDAVAELKNRWLALSGQTKYVGFGGQFRHVAYYTQAEVLEAIDSLEEALEDAGVLSA